MVRNMRVVFCAAFFLSAVSAPALEGAASAAMEKSSPSTRTQRSTACAVTPAYYCSPSSERDVLSTPTPGVLAARLSICRGDAEEASRVFQVIGSGNHKSSDFRFALGNLALLEGRQEEAVRIFTALKERSPEEGWGDWGLGLVALAKGDPSKASQHMHKGAAGRSATLEAETAVLKYLVRYWLRQESAPEEEAFLSLFSSLTVFRDCYRGQG